MDNKVVRFSVSCGQVDLDRLDALARLHHRSRSGELRFLINQEALKTQGLLDDSGRIAEPTTEQED